ncbi:MAG: 1-acyl-sn-glycerol-3-phosphate acyltransferase [Deltaproteobacteria bacterium]|nr:1-acyl-sn-glycerol-3-phosphate acyltransferase [Deltaproteobacteria bacterium]
MIRYLLINLFIGIHSIIFSLWAIIFILPFDRTGKYIHRFAARPWAKIILWVSGVKLQVNGKDYIHKTSAYIFMVNHQNYFDIFAVLAGIPADFKFILKQELMKIPLFGQAVRRAGYIGIERSDPKKAITSINGAADKIRKGASVLIYPEGTRNADGQVQPFKKGGFHLALKAGCDIIPVTIVYSNKIVPKGKRRIYHGTIIINIGKAVSIEEYKKNNMDLLIKRVRDTIISQMGDKRGK